MCAVMSHNAMQPEKKGGGGGQYLLKELLWYIHLFYSDFLFYEDKYTV